MEEPAFPYAILSPLAHKILLMTPLNELTEASRVEKEVKGEHPDSNRYPDAFVRLFKKINDLANKHPGSKRPILELINNHLTNYIPGQKSQLLGYLSHFILTLENTFQELPSSLVLALCVEYNKDTPNLGPKELLEIVAQINQALPNKKQRLLVLKAIFYLLRMRYMIKRI